MIIDWGILALAIIIFLALNTIIHFAYIKFKKRSFIEDMKARFNLARETSKKISDPARRVFEKMNHYIDEKTDIEIDRIKKERDASLNLIDIEVKKKLKELDKEK